MRSRVVALLAVAAVGVVALWWVFVYSPRGGELSDVRDEVGAAEQERVGLDSTLRRLQQIDADGPATDARLLELSQALPAEPDLAGFINGAHEIALDAGIDWISVAPAEPAEAPGAPPTINLTIQIEGGFFQVLDYMNRLEDLGRLVIVDSVNITTGAADGGDDTTATTAPSTVAGAPSLSATLTARMFTQTTLSAVPGTAPATPPGVTPTTVPATSPAASPTTQVLN
ncbi:MAG: type 4a pilus biogenesis protein PilO [Acidimicrobiia bacterium]|nr:type 4a pilus biogenesis protein PilO [Acidimicrobiia bacterium]